MDETDVLIIGAGPAGMMAAITAAGRGRRVILIEKNEKTGKKLFITGKGRCNLTNACDPDDLISNIVHNGKFMFSSLKRFDNKAVMSFFEGEGLRLKTERGNRVFPASDHSSDIIKALDKKLEKLKVQVRLKQKVLKLLTSDGVVKGALIQKEDGSGYEIYAESVIVACGGVSYPQTGSTGDGFRFAKEAGHKVIKPYPGLVPFDGDLNICPSLQGLTLKNVRISISDGEKSIYKCPEVGEVLFTHFGVSGPLILTASSMIEAGKSERGLILHMDLKPALSEEELDDRILRDFKENLNKEFKNSLGKLLPSKMIPIIVERSGIDPYKKVNGITKDERRKLIRLLKDLKIELFKPRGFEEAIITRGGVAVKEIDPKSFESKKVRGLYFAGEVLDVDALTGGFNLQIAWSSGYAAGENA